MNATAIVATDNIGIIILAAGQSKRFSGDKRQAKLNNGQTLLQSTLNNIPPSFSKRLLVLRPGDESLASQFESQWQICFASNSIKGMGASLANAINLVDDQWQGALVGLGDMPFIKSKTYYELQQSLVDHDIVYPVVNGKRGNPVGFNVKYFTEISQLSDDNGAKSLLKTYFEKCYQLPCSDTGVLRDIDTIEALKESL